MTAKEIQELFYGGQTQTAAKTVDTEAANSQIEMPETLGGDGLGNFGTYTNPLGESVGLSEAAFNAVKGTEHGGTLTGGDSGFDWGSAASTFSAGAKGLAALGSLYFANKNYKLQKSQNDYLKGRDARSDAKQAEFKANMNGTPVPVQTRTA